MSSISDLVAQALSGNMSEISNKIGADPQQTEKAISAALPTMIGALSRKAEGDDGGGLMGMLDRDGDGSALDDLAGFIGGGGHESRGNQVLDGLFGGKRNRVENAVGQASGLSADQSGMLMKMLGPLVMGALMKKAGGSSGGGLDMGSLVNMMQGERQEIERDTQQSSMIGRLVDQDGDGDFDFSDMAKIGMGYLGKMFRR